MNNDFSKLSDLAGIGIASYLLGISLKNYEINKDSFYINKKMLENSESNSICDLLSKIISNQNTIIDLLKKMNARE